MTDQTPLGDGAAEPQARGVDDDRREYLISWAARRGQAQFGWYRFVAPRWWPRSGRGEGLLTSFVAVLVKTRFAVFPPPPPPSEADVDEAALAKLLADASHSLPLQLAPPGTWAGTIALGFSGDQSPEQRALADLVRSRGLQVDPEYWRSGFVLAPMTRRGGWWPTFGEFATVEGLVGRGFEAYVRVLHPVEIDGDAPEGNFLRWRDLPGARLDEPAWRPDRRDDGSIDNAAHVHGGGELSEGVIPEAVRVVLAEHLRRDLEVRGDEAPVVQGLWEGFSLNVQSATDVRIEQPERDIVPFVGAFERIETFDDWHTSSIVFPESGAWCIANDTDLVSTYVGCGETLARALLADDRLETLRVQPGHPVG